MNTDYKLGLLYLVHLLVSVDGNIDEHEREAIRKICESEKINEDLFARFQADVAAKKERDVYQAGIEHISKCSDEERLRAFSILYRLSEADGRIHVKEVRLLLYSIKTSGLEFEDVVKAAGHINIF